MRAALTAAVLAAILSSPSAATGHMLPEERQGAQIVSAVRAGKLSTKRLSSAQYERVGEYLMGREVGSPALHQRMNTMMETMMGQVATDQVHVFLGRRYLGQITASSPAAVSMMGGGLPAGMMGHGIVGNGYGGHHGLDAVAIAGMVIGALAIFGAVATVLIRKRSLGG